MKMLVKIGILVKEKCIIINRFKIPGKVVNFFLQYPSLEYLREGLITEH